MLLGLAMVISLILTICILKYIELSPLGETSRERVIIATAARNLKWGEILTKELIKGAPFLKESLPTDKKTGKNLFFTDPSKLVNRIIRYPVKAGEPILESRLAPITSDSGGMAAVIDKEKRAMAVKVDKVIGVSGFIFPGHRVDVLVTLREQDPEKRDSGPITKTVLENIQVLASGTQMAVETEVGRDGKKQEKAVEVDVITLEVTPDEGEKLALAATEGKIQLALRSCSNIAFIPTRGITIPDLLASCRDSNAPQLKPVVKTGKIVKKRGTGKKGGKKVAGLLALPPTSVKSPFTVELIKGDKISEVTFE